MDDQRREVLRNLIEKHGIALCDEPRRLEGLLRDLCGERRREVNLLVTALRERVLNDLRNGSEPAASAVLVARLTKRLEDEIGLQTMAARWAVESWALALDVVALAVVPELTPERPTHVLGTGAKQHIVVAQGGDADFRSIGEAIAHATPGIQITVRPGLYQEELGIDKWVKIVGEGGRADIVVEGLSGPALFVHADQALIQGLTIQRHAEAVVDGAFAVDIRDGETVLEWCDVTSSGASCIAIGGTKSHALIRNCRIHDGSMNGVYVHGGASATLEDNDVFGNEGRRARGRGGDCRCNCDSAPQPYPGWSGLRRCRQGEWPGEIGRE